MTFPSSPTAPVLLIIFNRPDTTRTVLKAVSRAAPSRLFVAADGPREGRPMDKELCSQALDVVRRGISWECDVQYLIRERNLGCGMAPAQAITWFFQKVEEGIIIEDDCLPADAFFPFCTLLLARYRNEVKVSQISGFNCQFGRKRGFASYYFSRIFHCWGWASWRRAWDGFDFEMKDYKWFLAEKGLENLFPRKSVQDFWKGNFDDAAHGDGSIWDYQWVYKNLKEGSLAIVPNGNMIENIGFGEAATHTSRTHARMPPVSFHIQQNLVHPRFVIPDLAADEFTYRNHMKLGRWHSVKQLIKQIIVISLVALKAPLRRVYHAVRDKAEEIQFWCKRKWRKIRRRGKAFPVRNTFCILCVKRPAYALLAAQNINSLHYLYPGYQIRIMTDDECVRPLNRLIAKLDYPDMVEVINRFDGQKDPWQFQKVNCLMESSKNGWVLIDADTIWHDEPRIDPEMVTLLVKANVFGENDAEKDFLAKNGIVKALKWPHFVTGFVSLPSSLYSDELARLTLEWTKKAFLDERVKRISEEIGVNLAVQTLIPFEKITTLKESDGPNDRHIMQSLYYGCINEINE
jgi:hypothetical protein